MNLYLINRLFGEIIIQSDQKWVYNNFNIKMIL